jgi:hypothetical protein
MLNLKSKDVSLGARLSLLRAKDLMIAGRSQHDVGADRTGVPRTSDLSSVICNLSFSSHVDR